MTLKLHKVAQSGLRRPDLFVAIRVKPKRRASLAQRNVPLKAKLSFSKVGRPSGRRGI
ncbi:hypothetical protein [Marinomonas polaris]|uniref:hypothetical protein n=1 Tax=Marinomonas polaris TaxID=293552 RepID=UPI001587C4D6|nr:hypothetical protein [Marinomonas polaris]